MSSMKRIIVLYGKSNCGKSHTLEFLSSLIHENGGIHISPLITCYGDRLETFRYNEQIISVCPGGDNVDIIKHSFAYAYSQHADILITDSRSRGEGPSYINKEASHQGITIEWYEKSNECHLSLVTQKLCNKEFAEVILKTL